MISIKKLFVSFSHALRGLKKVLQTEQSFRIQVVVGVAVIVLSFVWPLAVWERILIFLLVGLVMVLELINSIFERIADGFKPRLNPIVGEIKDIMAGTVLISSVISAVIGFYILGPYLLEFLAKIY